MNEIHLSGLETGKKIQKFMDYRLMCLFLLNLAQHETNNACLWKTKNIIFF